MRINTRHRRLPLQQNTAIQRLGWSALLVVGLLLSSLAPKAQNLTWLRANGTKMVDASGQEVVLRGFNVGGWLLQESYILKTDSLNSQWRIKQALLRTMSEAQMENFYRQYRANFITKADIDFIAKQGFNCVRLPFHYDLFLTPAQRHARTQALRNPQNVAAYVQNLSTWYEQNQLFTDTKNLEGFRAIDDVLKWCAANKMYVILDLHAAPGGQGTDRNINDALVPLDLWKRRDTKGRLIYQDITVRLWEKLSARYKNDPRVAMYDFINEPHNLTVANGLSGDNKELSALYARLINTVRAQGDKHLVLLEGNGYGNEYTNLTPDKLAIKDKSNLAYNAHRYWCPNTPEAADSNPNQINLLKNLAAFRDKWLVPVWVGETGENSNEWFGAAVQGLNAQNIGWCHWTLKRVDGPTSLLRVKPYGSILTAEGRAALLRNVQYANCLPNKDVIVALTKPANYTAPFASLTIPGTIQAADYDLGRAGVAYHDDFSAKIDYRDTVAWNLGGAYRNDGVDIQVTTDSPGKKYSVGHLAVGEWMNYTVTVAAAGTYSVQVRVKSAPTPGKLLLKMDGVSVASLLVSQVDSAGKWMTATTKTATLPAGRHTLQLQIAQPVDQVSWLRFTPISTGSAGGQ
ncbi:Aryl-phospho-beta-D-glucosidase BglC, GH1 family [Hymenobacter gelipurpurascens]|uniref:Aryl-phospho-beta-D-glucosidase BglC, GH1 family n=1 Tax=Hymenobacter gelipurpurascens TaxID=89968 RepID=A0A212T6Q3_9BACT|nr:cellulase family glycosylhydrolase [Hymenobacter gelipurpurascens]SNC61511.1 Aryl-phospho-beta-D-glucosidase BglC, GH1 family [Hymenobacter gelipurpurascens]